MPWVVQESPPRSHEEARVCKTRARQFSDVRPIETTVIFHDCEVVSWLNKY